MTATSSPTLSPPRPDAQADLATDPIPTPSRRLRAGLGAAAALAAGGAVLAGAARLVAADPGIAVAVVITATLGVLIGLAQGATASDRRGRRRFVLIGLGLLAVAAGSGWLPGLTPVGGLLAGVGLVLLTMSATGWLSDILPAAPAATIVLTLVPTAAGIALGVIAPLAVVAVALAVGILGALAGSETVSARRTPVFVLPGAPRLAGRLPGALALLALVAAQAALLAGPFAAAIVVAFLALLVGVIARAGARRTVSTALAAPGTAGYSRAVTPFDATAKLRPASAATVTTVEDIRDALHHAREAGQGVSMHATGHAAMGHPDLSAQVLLRVRMAGDIELDVERGLVRIPAGASWSDVVPILSPHGLAVPHGSSGHVGVVGYLTRGGLSAYGRHTGVAANSIESIELITADGEARTVDRERDPEIFWALRGGGGGFGVVTAVTVRAFRPGEVVTGTTAWELSDAAAVADAWARWTATAPEGITTSLRVLEIPPLPGMPFALSRRPLLVIDGTAVDGRISAREAATGLLRDLRSVARPVLDTWRSAGIDEVPNTHMDPPFSPAHSSAHALLGEADWRDEQQARALVAAFVDAVGRPATGLGIAELRQLGGQLAEPAADGGAVSHYRGAFGSLAIALHGRGAPDAASAAVDRFQAAVAPWATGFTAPTLAVERERPARSFPAATADRVELERRRVDPTGLFRADVAVGALVR